MSLGYFDQLDRSLMQMMYRVLPGRGPDRCLLRKLGIGYPTCLSAMHDTALSVAPEEALALLTR